VEELNQKQSWTERALLLTIGLGAMLAPLNSTMIAVALPRLITTFDTTVTAASWLVTTYLIAMAALQPVAGKLGDRIGRRGLILGGFICFGVVSMGAAVAPNLPTLIFFRLLQAISGAIAIPNGTALVREVVPAHRRATSFGLVSALISLAAAIGPPLGGLLVQLAGWQAIFYINIPLVIAAVSLGWWTIPARQVESSKQSFDFIGALLLAMALSGIAAIFTQSRHSSTLLPTSINLVLVVGLIIVFLWHELRHRDPVIQIRFFRHRVFAAANGAIGLSNLAMYVTILALPQLLTQQGGWNDFQVGLVLSALSGTLIISSPFGGRLADQFGRRWPTVAGLALLTIGFVPLAITAGKISLLPLIVCLAIAGTGLGVSITGLQTSAIEALPAKEAGVASGVFSTSRYLGSIVGSSLLASLLKSASGEDSRFGAVFLLVAIAAFVSFLVSFGLQSRVVLANHQES